MLDIDTFVTLLYVIADDFCKDHFCKAQRKALPAMTRTVGAPVSLSSGEVLTLACLGQWQRFESERAFYRFASKHLRAAFPTLPHRSQLNRLIRAQRQTLTAFFLHLAARLGTKSAPYQALDSTAVPTRCAKRRGQGWLFGQADIGHSNRLGWYEGFHLLVCVSPMGAVTGFGFSPASINDQRLAETFLAVRHGPGTDLSSVSSVGAPTQGTYLADCGFEGVDWHAHWRADYGADVLIPPKPRHTRRPWPKRLRRWVSGLRQIVETVNEKLLNTFGLARERPHALSGFWARLSAKMALHNFCIWLNGQLGRAPLAFADLIDW